MLAIEILSNGLCDIVIVGTWYILSESSKRFVSIQNSGAGVIIMEFFEHANKRQENIFHCLKNSITKVSKIDKSWVETLKTFDKPGTKIDYIVLYTSPEAKMKERDRDILFSMRLPYLEIKEEVPGVSSLFTIVESIKRIEENNKIKSVMINAVSDRNITLLLTKTDYGTKP